MTDPRVSRQLDLTARATRRLAGFKGFTFLEILVVMAAIAVLLGLGIGFLANVGRSTMAQQAASILAESGQRCLNLSAGGKRAVLEIASGATAEGGQKLEVRTSVEKPVLAANFESKTPDKAEPDWFEFAGTEPTNATVTGAVTLDLAGKSGACAVFKSGGTMEYGNRAAFAMTNGLALSCWVRPDAAGRSMTLMKADAEGMSLWEVRLVQSTGRLAAFDIELRVRSVPEDAEGGSSGNEDLVAATSGSPVPAGRWSQIEVSWDGRDSTIAVSGVPARRVDRGRVATTKPDAAPVKARRLSVPSSGVVRLTTGPSYVGGLDTLTVSGIFRSDEDVRRLPWEVTLLRAALPVRVVFANGRLDPLVHHADVVVRLAGPGDSETGGYTLVRFGLYGSLPPPRRVEPQLEDGGMEEIAKPEGAMK